MWQCQTQQRSWASRGGCSCPPPLATSWLQVGCSNSGIVKSTQETKPHVVVVVVHGHAQPLLQQGEGLLGVPRGCSNRARRKRCWHQACECKLGTFSSSGKASSGRPTAAMALTGGLRGMEVGPQAGQQQQQLCPCHKHAQAKAAAAAAEHAARRENKRTGNIRGVGLPASAMPRRMPWNRAAWLSSPISLICGRCTDEKQPAVHEKQ